MTLYYDIGVNLFTRSFPNPHIIIDNAETAGITCILTGSNRKENELVNDFVSLRNIYGTAGIHPHNADDACEEDFSHIEATVSSNPRIIAVGECGLDYDRMYSSKQNQLAVFRRLISIAKRTKKPLFLHERDAEEDFIACFREYPELCHRSVVHCYTGNKITLERLLDMGFFIGITGWICDERRGDSLREAVSILPLDRVLLETDAPYLTPRGIPGLARTNVPQNIVHVSRALAQYMHLEEETLRVAAKRNTERLFRIPS